ncbi:MAG: LysR family transcriptional regulator [Proteobacteria bacterium]|nr:LysR family transcriptional regulator [Pseudomonadota bacterium]
MNWQAVSFDWNHVRAFLATVEEGSLSAAARALGLTQPTLGRQVTALEQNLGVMLFERGRRSMSLTQPGLELLDHVRAMGEAARRISLTATGQSRTIEGQVSISASEVVSAYVLPPVLKKLRGLAPGIEIDVIASNSLSDLSRREADIAIRHVRPEQPDLIAKLVRETTGHLYAATAYLDAHGRPGSAGALSKADFIGFESPERLLSVLNARGISLTRRNFKLTSANGVVVLEMVKQGLGIGVMAKEIAALMPGIECVLPQLDPIPIPIWLTTHRELHTSRRIRLVFDLLADAFS